MLIVAAAFAYFYFGFPTRIIGTWVGTPDIARSTMLQGTQEMLSSLDVSVNVQQVGTLGELYGTMTFAGQHIPLSGRVIGSRVWMNASLPVAGMGEVEFSVNGGSVIGDSMSGNLQFTPNAQSNAGFPPVSYSVTLTHAGVPFSDKSVALTGDAAGKMLAPPPGYALRFFDDFDADQNFLNPAWETVNASSGGNSIAVTGGSLAMYANSGNNIAPGIAAAPMTLTHEPLAGDFALIARLSWNSIPLTGGCCRAVGIIAYADSYHWTYLDQFPENRISVEYASGTQSQNNALTDEALSNPIFLKLMRLGDKFYYSWSRDGSSWNAVGAAVGQAPYLELPAMPAALQVGVEARSWGTPITGYCQWVALYTP